MNIFGRKKMQRKLERWIKKSNDHETREKRERIKDKGSKVCWKVVKCGN